MKRSVINYYASMTQIVVHGEQGVLIIRVL